MNIHVTTYNDKDEIVRECVIDHAIPYNRKWLAKHEYWCWNNGHAVLTYRTDEPATFGYVHHKAPKGDANV